MRPTRLTHPRPTHVSGYRMIGGWLDEAATWPVANDGTTQPDETGTATITEEARQVIARAFGVAPSAVIEVDAAFAPFEAARRSLRAGIEQAIHRNLTAAEDALTAALHAAPQGAIPGPAGTYVTDPIPDDGLAEAWDALQAQQRYDVARERHANAAQKVREVQAQHEHLHETWTEVATEYNDTAAEVAAAHEALHAAQTARYRRG